MRLLLYINCWKLGFHVSWKILVKIWTLSILYASCIMTLFLYTNSWEFRFHVSWRILFKILDPVYLYASCIMTLFHVRVGRGWPRAVGHGCERLGAVGRGWVEVLLAKTFSTWCTENRYVHAPKFYCKIFMIHEI